MISMVQVVFMLLFTIYVYMPCIDCNPSKEYGALNISMPVNSDQQMNINLDTSEHYGETLNTMQTEGLLKKSEKRSAKTDDKTIKNSTLNRRSPKKTRPGVLWTLARVTFETFNDTQSAVRQISQIINDNIVPDQPKKSNAMNRKKKPMQPKLQVGANVNDTVVNSTMAPETTTEPEFKLTRSALQSLIRRNVKGLVRLFNIEWKDAIDQSQKNIREFRQDLGKQIALQLQDNPNAY